MQLAGIMIARTDEIRAAFVACYVPFVTPDEAGAAFDAWHERQKTRRPKRGVIDSLEALNALAVGSIIGVERGSGYRVYERWTDGRGDIDWLTTTGAVFDSDWLPADIIWIPRDE